MKKISIKEESIASVIHLIRGEKVILDYNLAALYGVETRILKQAVRRNLKRFPRDFMFELNKEEDKLLRSQNARLRKGTNSKYVPFAFTEQGVAMLSGTLNSDRAIQINIAIMRTFVQIRRFFIAHSDLEKKFHAMEKRYNYQFDRVFEAIKMLTTEKQKSRKRIGFKIHNDDTE